MELDFEKYKEEQFCDNKKCEFYGMIGDGNVKIKSRKNQQVYCNRCKNSWVITKGTFFFHMKSSPKDALEVLFLLSEGMGMRAVCRAKGVTMDILQIWIVKAANHVNEVSSLLKEEMNLTGCQIDEFWSFIRKKRDVYLKEKKK